MAIGFGRHTCIHKKYVIYTFVLGILLAIYMVWLLQSTKVAENGRYSSSEQSYRVAYSPTAEKCTLYICTVRPALTLSEGWEDKSRDFFFLSLWKEFRGGLRVFHEKYWQIISYHVSCTNDLKYLYIYLWRSFFRKKNQVICQKIKRTIS